MKKAIAIIVLMVLFVAACSTEQTKPKQIIEPTNDIQGNVTDFDSCVAAGNPITESYPAQCRYGDVTYTEGVDSKKVIIEEEKLPEEYEKIATDLQDYDILDSPIDLREVMEIAAQSECLKEEGTRLTESVVYNQNTRTWWIDLEMDKPNCAPACVVNVDTKEAVINWRCTGALVPGE